MIKQILMNYIESINEHDITKIYNLMTEDYVFIDTYDSMETGKENMKNSWIGYFD